MEIATLLVLVAQCAPLVHPTTAQALIATESAANPHAIGVVGGRLERQPANQGQAVATARALQMAGWNFSVGVAQINRYNFKRLGLTLETAFEPCRNLAAMQTVLLECFARAGTDEGHAGPDQHRLRRALSCYYSGNFRTGFDHGYVDRVVSQIRRI